MRRLVIALSLFLIAASAGEVATQLEENGYYIEPGASVSEQVVSDAVFAGRSDGGRLYLVVLSEEPPGGAPTFSDSVLDQLGDGYVVTVAPETVGFAGDGTFWSADEMNAAIDASLEAGGSDDQVIETFIAELTGTGAIPSPDDEQPSSQSGTSALWVLVVLIGVGALVFFAVRRSSRQKSERAVAELEKVKARAREKLAEIANDIIDMEDEVELSENAEVKAHYQRASATYTDTLARVEASQTPTEMVDVVHQLDLAIWELDAAEALLDGKAVPAKPEPPQSAPPPRPRQETGQTSQREKVDDAFGRRPGRQSSYAGNDLMTALWAILAMSQRGPGGFGGLPGGFGGPMGGGGGSGGTRMRGGGFRGGGGGRIRGGGRRR